MSVRARRERDRRFERERAVLDMRSAVVAALAPAYLDRVGSSALLEAVDEALLQLVASGAHLGEPDGIKALWITCARRRLIDEGRSAESKHRAVDASEVLCAALSDMTDEARQRWRVREILGVLRGDQRRWAEAWYDEVLSSSRARGGQPRGLPEALGWTPAKTKTVSRKARRRMAAFIDARASGAVCEQQRARLDAFIVAARDRDLEDERYRAVLFHVAGCQDCWAAWHARRRDLLGRGLAVVPLDAVAGVAQTLAAKVAGLWTAAQVQALSLPGRAGVGGAAAAGGGAATLGGKATAVCVGVACVAAAGGEVAHVLVSKAPRAPAATRSVDERPRAAFSAGAARRVVPAAPVVSPRLTSAAREKVSVAPKRAVASRVVVRATPPDLPDATFTARRPPPPVFAGGAGRSGCAPGSLGC